MTQSSQISSKNNFFCKLTNFPKGNHNATRHTLLYDTWLSSHLCTEEKFPFGVSGLQRTRRCGQTLIKGQSPTMLGTFNQQQLTQLRNKSDVSRYFLRSRFCQMPLLGTPSRSLMVMSFGAWHFAEILGMDNVHASLALPSMDKQQGMNMVAYILISSRPKERRSGERY
jgi:hypothetical protein